MLVLNASPKPQTIPQITFDLNVNPNSQTIPQLTIHSSQDIAYRINLSGMQLKSLEEVIQSTQMSDKDKKKMSSLSNQRGINF